MKYGYWLTIAITTLAALACTLGVAWPGIYRDAPLYKTAWQANDAVTMLILPILVTVCKRMTKGSVRAYLIWLGLVGYVFYNYAFYLFGAEFNALFIIYALLVSLSLYTLIIGFYNVPIWDLMESPPSKSIRMITGLFLFVIVLSLGAVEGKEWVKFVLMQKRPEIPKLVLALDLSIVLPTSVLSVILLWSNNIWGYVIAVIMVIKSITYGTVLIAGTSFIALRGLNPIDPLIPFYSFLAAGGLTVSWLILKKVKSSDSMLISMT